MRLTILAYRIRVGPTMPSTPAGRSCRKYVAVTTLHSLISDEDNERPAGRKGDQVQVPHPLLRVGDRGDDGREVGHGSQRPRRLLHWTLAFGCEERAADPRTFGRRNLFFLQHGIHVDT